MPLPRALFAILLTLAFAGAIAAQDAPMPRLTPGPERKPEAASSAATQPAPPQTVALKVAKGSPLQVALD
ncbi:MAG: hypothetical protein WB566_04240, partial [Terriglobales bacterium]